MGYEEKIETLLSQMSLAEKIGQLQQMVDTGEELAGLVRQGAVGALIKVLGKEGRSTSAWPL